MKTFSKSRGLPVATIAEGALVGKLDDFLFELETGRIFGYRLKAGVLPRSGGVAARDVARVGRDLVLVSSEAAVDWSGVSRVAEEGRAWASRYRGARVMTRRGAAVGEVTDLLFQSEPHEVRAFLLDGNRVVQLDGGVSVGRDALILDDAAAAMAVGGGEPETTDWWVRVRGAFSPDRKD